MLFGLSDADTQDEAAQRHRVNRLYYGVLTLGRLAVNQHRLQRTLLTRFSAFHLPTRTLGVTEQVDSNC